MPGQFNTGLELRLQHAEATRIWVQERLGGYVRMSIEERREAVRNLTDEGHSARETAEILGVSNFTVSQDVRNLTPIDTVAALAADDKIRREVFRTAKEDERKAARDAEQHEDGCRVEDLTKLITAGKKYAVIYADPPWSFKVNLQKGQFLRGLTRLAESSCMCAPTRVRDRQSTSENRRPGRRRFQNRGPQAKGRALHARIGNR